MSDHTEEWWEADDPAVFGPVAYYQRVGEIPRHMGDYQYARWDKQSGAPLLLVGPDGKTIEIEPDLVGAVSRPKDGTAGRVEILPFPVKGSMTNTRGA